MASVVELLREGRAALHTSFACYKFLIIYGLSFSIFKLTANWYILLLYSQQRTEEVLFLYYEKELIELILSRCKFSVGQLAHHYHTLLLLCTQIDWCCNLPCLNCRYGAIPCQMDYLFIDGVAVLSLGYSMNLSNPQKKLSQVWKPMPLCIRSSLNYIKIPDQNFAIQSRLTSQETCNDMKTTFSGV